MFEELGAMGDLWDDPLQPGAYRASVESTGTNDPSSFYALLLAATTPPAQDMNIPQNTTHDNMYDSLPQQNARQWVQQSVQLSVPNDNAVGQQDVQQHTTDTFKAIEQQPESSTPMNGLQALQDSHRPLVTDEMIGISQYLRYAQVILETTHSCSPALEKARPIYHGFLKMLWTQWIGGIITTGKLFHELNKFVNAFVGNPEFSFIRECKAWYDREHQREQEERTAQMRQYAANCEQGIHVRGEGSYCSSSLPRSQGELYACYCPGPCICPFASSSHPSGAQYGTNGNRSF
ncbi:hypothetical protein BWQ96_01858 [Gracilariopsis chorda]|uniref:Uncharacterized protein n=1 Tax=Gracilariopsis chorda TaxID=448386 RepID=A0A2V3J1W9_9FLOR|nr:hypothetical protein BWQ96_01858 [Gracilariopsis chorda]|eukprot:PXF48398.1 hypothetical protein BWQ96_01858 [Gracilariopsis chorda]